ncbi:MAG: type II toxin-antitoxin system VapC family toxin [Candidatus Heimdallarchaeota archaeon]|nr:MAG: type II toxin-antitoxin system VapC family toxin [Candidatus Heimdallarchaeota archaeon]
MLIYLDSSIIVKRYIQEEGTSFADFLFDRASQGYFTLALNLLNVGEVLGVFDQYLRRNWVDQEAFNKMMAKFVDETLRLLRINQLVILPTLSSLQMDSWTFVLKHRLYIVDAIQISSSKRLKANYFCSGDKYITNIASELDLEVYKPENESAMIQRIESELS